LQSAPQVERGFALDRVYQERGFPPDVNVNYTFVGLLPTNTTRPPNIAMPDNYLQWSDYPNGEHQWPIRETAKIFFIFHYALENTTARWIYRAFDDIMVNWRLLGDYLRALESKYDPRRDVVIRGDCIVNGPAYSQGGSGMLLSRRAVEEFAPMGNYTIWEVGRTCDHDDKKFGALMYHLGINAGAHASSAFVGYNFRDEWRFSEGNWTGLPLCPNVTTLSQDGCKKFVAPLSQIVFFHMSPFSLTSVRKAQMIWRAPQWVRFFRPWGYIPELCRYVGPPFDGKFTLI
jgi:hypothetical protein